MTTFVHKRVKNLHTGAPDLQQLAHLYLPRAFSQTGESRDHHLFKECKHLPQHRKNTTSHFPGIDAEPLSPAGQSQTLMAYLLRYGKGSEFTSQWGY